VVTEAYHRGDRVIVTWGLDSVEGVIEGVYSSPRGSRVIVSVPVRGPSGQDLDRVTVTLPATAVEGVLA
jgi:hypothetical protein